MLGLTKLLVVKPSLADALAEYAQGSAAAAARPKESQKLRVDVTEHGQVTVLSLHGFVDRHTIALLDGELGGALGQGRVRIVLDCAELTYISSNGMGVFISYVNKARHQGGDIRLCNLRDVARTVITMLGLHRHFQVFESQNEAVASFARG
jgi:anti-anti-sigma factor